MQRDNHLARPPAQISPTRILPFAPARSGAASAAEGMKVGSVSADAIPAVFRKSRREPAGSEILMSYSL